MLNHQPWNDKLDASKPPKRVKLEKKFAGVAAGQWLYVGNPKIIADYIEKIPYGKTSTVIQLRQDLAAANRCDAMCPVSTAIFIRIVAEAAIEDMQSDMSLKDVTPFWRLLEPDAKITQRLSIDGAWVAEQRQVELATR